MLCLGPVCVPVWQVGVIVALILGPFKAIAACLYDKCTRRRRSDNKNEDALQPSSLFLYRGASGSSIYEDISRRVTQKQFPVLRIQTDEKMKEFWRKTRNNSEIPVFADFSAQWCGPCRAISPFYELLSAGYEGVFLSIDIDDCPNTAEAAGVSVLPTLAALKSTSPGAAQPWEVVANTSGANARQWEEFVAGYTIPRSTNSSTSS